jgi:hypothetical protein
MNNGCICTVRGIIRILGNLMKRRNQLIDPDETTDSLTRPAVRRSCRR